jgi:uncharacterized repeat protein (TIGR03803 family)
LNIKENVAVDFDRRKEKNMNAPLRRFRLSLMFAILAMLTVVAASSAQARTFKSLYSFTNSPDGTTPYGAVVKDKSGNLFGTTSAGGASGFGTVYELSKSGKETVLYSFTGGADGSVPYADLVIDKSGNL